MKCRFIKKKGFKKWYRQHSRNIALVHPLTEETIVCVDKYDSAKNSAKNSTKNDNPRYMNNYAVLAKITDRIMCAFSLDKLEANWSGIQPMYDQIILQDAHEKRYRNFDIKKDSEFMQSEIILKGESEPTAILILDTALHELKYDKDYKGY